MSLLRIENLRINIGASELVRGVDLAIDAGRCLALVGESGSGKSLTAMALMRLLPGNARQSQAHWEFDGQSLADVTEQGWRSLRSRRIGVIFQNPMSALNPTTRVGRQIAEVMELHLGLGRREAMQRAVALLERLGIVNAQVRARQYPFQMSGGMLQRVMIAMAVACKPALLIADEPTTALDVTVQAEVLALLEELCAEQGTGLLLITHDLGVVARMADDVAVMYAGRIVERGPMSLVFKQPAHPYTRALKEAMPALGQRRGELTSIPGTPPDLSKALVGCAFAPRCPRAMRICARELPDNYRVGDGQCCECWLWDPRREVSS